MGLPGHRRTSSDKRRRAAHFALKKTNLGVCTKCASAVLPHRACAKCGFYSGKQVLKIVQRTKAKHKHAHDQDHAGHAHDNSKPESKKSE